MAKIIDPLVKWYLAKTIDRLESKIEFITEYQPILIEEKKHKIESRLSLLALRNNHRLLPLSISSGIATEYVLEAKALETKKIEDSAYWHHRALEQTHKRAIKKGGADPSAIDAKYQNHLQAAALKKQAKLDALKSKYAQNPEMQSQSKTQYELLRERLETGYQTLKTKLESDYRKFADQKQNTMTESLAKLNIDLKKSLERFSHYESIVNPLSGLIDEDTILKLDHLSMHFGGLKAVDDLSFSVKKGEIFGLIGPNGAGKTTVFNCITRFYRPTSGSVYYRNYLNEPLDLNRFKVHNVIKEGIVRTFQNVELIWELPVLENLLVAGHTLYRTGFFGQLFNIRRIRREEMIMRQKAMKILADLDLLQYQYMYPLGLPYGILKKVELGRTLMVNPALIILDEPAAGLNDVETDNLAITIKKIQNEYHTTIFLVEHHMGLVMKICDTICAISFGKLLAIGTPQAIQASKVVREAYLGGE